MHFIDILSSFLVFMHQFRHVQSSKLQVMGESIPEGPRQDQDIPAAE
jgi:hypothetical protein